MRDYERGRDRKGADGGRLTKVSGALLVRRFAVREPGMYRIIEEVSAKKPASIDKASLCELAQTVMDLELDGIDGDFVQAGGTAAAAAVIAHAKRRTRMFTAYEVPYEQTVPESGECGLASLDCAEYGPMRVLLERMAPRLVSGGHLIINAYKKDGCRKAVDEYFRGKKGFQLVRKSCLHVIKN